MQTTRTEKLMANKLLNQIFLHNLNFQQLDEGNQCEPHHFVTTDGTMELRKFKKTKWFMIHERMEWGWWFEHAETHSSQDKWWMMNDDWFQIFFKWKLNFPANWFRIEIWKKQKSFSSLKINWKFVVYSEWSHQSHPKWFTHTHTHRHPAVHIVPISGFLIRMEGRRRGMGKWWGNTTHTQH